MSLAGYVAHMGETRTAYRNLVGKPEGKSPLRRPLHRWEDNIRLDFREMGWEGEDWILLAICRDQSPTVVNMDLRDP